MADKKEVSAQVVLKGADRSVSGENITSENVGRSMPAEDDLRRATKHFKDLGFKVEHPFANSFSISGPTALFEKVFKTKLSEEGKGGLKAKHASGSKSFELPMTGLPNDVEKLLDTVTFSEPPDFGPGNF